MSDLKVKKSGRLKITVAAVLIIGILTCIMVSQASGEELKYTGNLYELTGFSRKFYSTIPVWMNGINVDNALLDSQMGVLYVPLETALTAAGIEAEVNINTASGEYTISTEGLDFYAAANTNYIKVNNRYFYAKGDTISVDGRVYVQGSVLSDALGIDVREAGDMSSVSLSDNKHPVAYYDSDYYSETYGEENLFYLSRIINCEALGEPFECMVGIGNVIMNRVDDPYFPDTIKEVIFDDEVAVQFPPAYNDALGIPPEDISVAAACLCFEGLNLVGDSEFFVQPEIGDTAWFNESLSYVCTYGNHAFYED